ncbi:MAG: hypothetical protein SGILL_009191, partial [Bacillariaceae sp.]
MIKTVAKPHALYQGPNPGNINDGHYIQPRIVNQTTADSYQKHWSPLTTAVPFHPHQCTNFGHVLGDDVFAMYRLLKNHGVYHPELQFLPMRIDCGKKGQCDNGCKRLSQIMDPFLQNAIEKPSHLTGAFRQYYMSALGISKESYTDLEGKQTLPLLCFENMVSGIYYYTDHGEDPNLHGLQEDKGGTNMRLIGSADTILDFRNQYLERLGLDPNAHLTRSCKTKVGEANPSIVIIPRRVETSRASGWNESELVERLQESLPNDPVTVLDFSKHDLIDQLQLTVNSKVLVTMTGGASYLSWFLPAGATAVLITRKHKVNDGYIYDNLPFIRKEYVYGNVTADPEEFDFAEIAKSVKRGVSDYDDRYHGVAPGVCD